MDISDFMIYFQQNQIYDLNKRKAIKLLALYKTISS